MTDLNPGDIAPQFVLPTDGGGEFDLSSFRGKTVVLYFYPKDSTPGCTTQAIGFTQAKGHFDAANTIVIGVSKDSTRKHDNFKAKNELQLILGTDEDGTVIASYRSWILKMLYGREYMGIDRSTFLIDGGGKIVQIWRKVRVKGHVETVLEACQALNE